MSNDSENQPPTSDRGDRHERGNSDEPGTRRPAFEPHDTCPWWVGYLLASPLRRIWENPDRLLAPHVQPGMTVVDLGCAMGFFARPLAKRVGDVGRVVCVDIQERMLSTLDRKIRRWKLDHILETRRIDATHPALDDLTGQADVALAWHVVHETSDPLAFFGLIFDVLQPGGRLLFSEPKRHVPAEQIQAEIDTAQRAGFVLQAQDTTSGSEVVVFVKPDTE